MRRRYTNRKKTKQIKNKKNKTAKRSQYKKRRSTYRSKKVRGGDYSESTIKSIEGFPIKDEEVTISAPGIPPMTVSKYREYMEKISQNGSTSYLD